MADFLELCKLDNLPYQSSYDLNSCLILKIETTMN